LRHAGDLGELPLERGRDGRCHGDRIGTRELRRYLDGRKVDLRKRRNREKWVSGQSDEKDADH
jgi:hypothetical protein